MKKTRTLRGSAALSAATIALSVLGLGVTTAPTATAASSAGWCNGSTYTRLPNGAKGYVPTYSGKWNCTMSRGASGEHVKTLQRTLKYCYNQPIAIDGQFGPATQTALKYAQNMTYYPGVDIVGDGVYGPITAEYLAHHATHFDGEQACGSLHG